MRDACFQPLHRREQRAAGALGKALGAFAVARDGVALRLGVGEFGSLESDFEANKALATVNAASRFRHTGIAPGVAVFSPLPKEVFGGNNHAKIRFVDAAPAGAGRTSAAGAGELTQAQVLLKQMVLDW